MGRLVRFVVALLLVGTALTVGAPTPDASAEQTPEPFSIEGTVDGLDPTLIGQGVKIDGSGFRVSPVTNASPNLAARAERYGRVAVRVTPATSYRTYRNGAFREISRDAALKRGTEVWAYGFMAPLPTQVAQDEAVATQVIVGPRPSGERFRVAFSQTQGTSVGPDFTGQSFTWDGDCVAQFVTYSVYAYDIKLDDGAGNTLFGYGEGSTFASTASVLSGVNVSITGGTGRFAGATGTGTLDYYGGCTRGVVNQADLVLTVP